MPDQSSPQQRDRNRYFLEGHSADKELVRAVLISRPVYDKPLVHPFACFPQASPTSSAFRHTHLVLSNLLKGNQAASGEKADN